MIWSGGKPKGSSPSGHLEVFLLNTHLRQLMAGVPTPSLRAAAPTAVEPGAPEVQIQDAVSGMATVTAHSPPPINAGGSRSPGPSPQLGAMSARLGGH